LAIIKCFGSSDGLLTFWFFWWSADVLVLLMVYWFFGSSDGELMFWFFWSSADVLVVMKMLLPKVQKVSKIWKIFSIKFDEFFISYCFFLQKVFWLNILKVAKESFIFHNGPSMHTSPWILHHKFSAIGSSSNWVNKFINSKPLLVFYLRKQERPYFSVYDAPFSNMASTFRMIVQYWHTTLFTYLV